MRATELPTSGAGNGLFMERREALSSSTELRRQRWRRSRPQERTDNGRRYSDHAVQTACDAGDHVSRYGRPKTECVVHTQRHSAHLDGSPCGERELHRRMAGCDCQHHFLAEDAEQMQRATGSALRWLPGPLALPRRGCRADARGAGATAGWRRRRVRCCGHAAGESSCTPTRFPPRRPPTGRRSSCRTTVHRGSAARPCSPSR